MEKFAIIKFLHGLAPEFTESHPQAYSHNFENHTVIDRRHLMRLEDKFWNISFFKTKGTTFTLPSSLIATPQKLLLSILSRTPIQSLKTNCQESEICN